MDFLLTHLFRVMLLLITLAAGISWWLVPAPQPASPYERTQTDAWTLPATKRAKPETSVASISNANLWGTVDAAAPASLNELEWRFVGVTVNGSDRYLMISVNNQPPQMLKAGHQLPGGARIVEIGEDHLCIIIDGKKRRLELFQ